MQSVCRVKPKVWAVTGKGNDSDRCVWTQKEQDCLRLYMGSNKMLLKRECVVQMWHSCGWERKKAAIGRIRYKEIFKLSCGFYGIGGTTDSFCLKAFVVVILTRPIQIMLLLSLKIITIQCQIHTIFVFDLFIYFCFWVRVVGYFIVGCLKPVCSYIWNWIWVHF